MFSACHWSTVQSKIKFSFFYIFTIGFIFKMSHKSLITQKQHCFILSWLQEFDITGALKDRRTEKMTSKKQVGWTVLLREDQQPTISVCLLYTAELREEESLHTDKIRRQGLWYTTESETVLAYLDRCSLCKGMDNLKAVNIPG